MKRRIPFLAILVLMLSGRIYAQPEYKAGGDKVQYEKELRAFLQLRNISAEETEIYIRNVLNTPLPSESGNLKGSPSMLLDSSSCLNSDFELSAAGTYTAANGIPGWQLNCRTITMCNAQNGWQPGSPEFYIVSTPFFFQTLAFPHSPLGGTKVAQLNNTNPSYLQTMLTKSILVTTSNYKFVYAFAGILNDGSHQCCEQPHLKIRINNSSCGEYFAGTPGSSCPTSVAKGFTSYNSNSGQYYYSGWQIDTINLFPYIGLTIDINFIASDCIYGGHFGSMFIDTQCQGSSASCDEINFPGHGSSISFCQGASTAVIHGVPNTGFSSYKWISPTGSLSAQQASSSVLTITNPVAGSVYTLQLVAPGFCNGLITTYTLVYTQTSIKCLETSPSCISNASGSATVTARGSGSGYQFTWSTLTQTFTGTNSVITGLAPGVYTLNAAGNGTGCGTAITVFTIGSFNGAAPVLSINPVLAHICAGNQASLNAQGSATSFTWSGGANTSGIVVSPLAATNYTLTGANSGMPCTSTVTAWVNVSSVNLSAVASKTSVCPGDVITMTASGTQNYSWNFVPGSSGYTIAPTSNTVFIVTGSSVFSGLTCTDTETITLNLRQVPYVFVTGSPRICQGDSSTYIGGGATVYTWHTGEVNPSMSFTTPVAGHYSVCVTGVDPGGCIGKYCLPVEVGLCTGLSEQSITDEFVVYPNPSHGEFVVKMTKKVDFVIYNELMQVVYKNLKQQENNTQILVKLSSGIYFIHATGCAR